MIESAVELCHSSCDQTQACGLRIERGVGLHLNAVLFYFFYGESRTLLVLAEYCFIFFSFLGSVIISCLSRRDYDNVENDAQLRFLKLRVWN